MLLPTEVTGLPPAAVNISEILSVEGHATSAIGRWHLRWREPFRSHRPGIDFHHGPPYSNVMLIWQSDTVLRLQHTFREWPLLDNH